MDIKEVLPRCEICEVYPTRMDYHLQSADHIKFEQELNARIDGMKKTDEELGEHQGASEEEYRKWAIEEVIANK